MVYTKYHTKLAKMGFEDIFDLTADGFLFLFFHQNIRGGRTYARVLDGVLGAIALHATLYV